ncbi:MAG: ATP-binding protein [Phycisphaerae bacterium]|nr:ATP-binding protein [Phycisphaerae bacterium]
MMSLGQSAGSSSLQKKLLLPVAIGVLLIVFGGYFSTQWIGGRNAMERLHDRAQTIAQSVIYAAESLKTEDELQAFVSTLGRDFDITELVIVRGSPPQVVASTHSAWVGEPLDRLPAGDVKADLYEALAGNAQHFHNHPQTREVDCTLPVRPGFGRGLLPDGAVSVHMDSTRVEEAVAAWSRAVAWGFLAVAVGVFAGVWYLTRSEVIRPINALLRAVEAETDMPDDTSDEFGALSKAIDRSRGEARHARFELETALHENHALRRTLDEHTIISVAGSDGRIIDVSQGFCSISGYSREELIGCDHRIVNSGFHPKQFWVDVWRQISSGRAWHGEVCNRRKDGTLYWVDSTIVPYRDRGGRIEKYVSIRLDIDAHKRTQEELRFARQAAEEANRAKSDFLANISHEVRTPLTAILGYADVLLEPGLAAEQRRTHVDTIKRNGEHLLAVINDVLDLSKIEAGKVEVESIPTSLAQVLLDVESLMGVRAAAKRLSLRTELLTPIPREIQSDPTRLKQILMNLVGNSIKFTERGEVVVSVEVESPDVAAPRFLIRVRDTGIGMSSSQLGRLFQAFSQGDATTTRRFGGTGLGLRISRSYAELLGGDLTAQSRIGEGSVFTLILPIRSKDGVGMLRPDELRVTPSTSQTKPVTQGEFAAARPLNGLVIYVAEDGPDNQRLIRHHLQQAGAEVLVFDNGLMALEALSVSADVEGRLKDPPPCDLLITDMQMPEMDGYTLARTLRNRAWPRPIVALTAHAMAGDAERCLQAGCDSYASKPFDRLRLIATCRDVVAQHGSRRDIGSARPAQPVTLMPVRS